MSFDTIPSKASLKIQPFKAHVSQEELDDFKQLVRLSKIGPKTYENQITDVKDFTSFGISRQWMEDAKKHWETKYDWRKTEDRINALPNFTASIEDSGYPFEIHFAALFSNKADAAPMILLHGWPGSFLEFVSTLEQIKKKCTPDTLPFHLIVPSLPGYGYSNGPPLDKNFDIFDMSRVMDKLMVGLGFGEGYIAQGGDVGSFVARVLAVKHEACKVAHLHLVIGASHESQEDIDKLSAEEKQGLERYNNFGWLGNAYAREHGTRPSTIGLVLSSSPIALLAWVGEKFLQWSDQDPPLDEILDGVTLYWLTQSFPRAIYSYRQFFGAKSNFIHPDPAFYIKKPLGYSWHHKELAPVPKDWVAKTGNLVWYRAHMEGGHFAAMERPDLFIKDMEDFVGEVWPQSLSGKL
ncbi:Epoxide hydrolase [Teratosphaeria destructans]|uniref:Epoxide hydrolase n=1 Tax=Teratosphaeria destructans TaxID=418781 RepID=A0A9W7W6Z5_9PEZI|nr:Epoxide hydrolase [Teratosphaeria destructans]